MTNRWDYMQTLLAQRDTALVSLAFIAISLVVAWVLVPSLPIPARWKTNLQNLYMVGGIGLYVFTLAITLFQ